MTISRWFRIVAMMLIAVMFSDSFAFASKKPVDPAVMKAKIQARGVGQGVRVTLANNEDAQGLIVAVGDQSFTLKYKKSGDTRQIEYAQIVGVHNDHLSRGQKVGLVVGVVGVGIVIVVAIAVHDLNNAKF